MKIIGILAGGVDGKLLVEASSSELANLMGYASKWDLERTRGKHGDLNPGTTIEVHDNWKLLSFVLDARERGMLANLRKVLAEAISKLDAADELSIFGRDEEEEDHD